MASGFDRFTERARRALQYAHEAAVQLRSPQIGAEHLLLGLARDRTSVAAQAVIRLGVNLDDLVGSVPARADAAQPTGGLSADAQRSIELAVDEARTHDHHYIGTEHLLLGLLRLPSSPAAEALEQRGVSLERARTAVAAVLAEQPTSPSQAVDVQSQLADDAKQVLVLAESEAQRLSHNYLGTEHLLLGLVHDPETGVARLLGSLGVDLDKARHAVEFIIGRGDRPMPVTLGLTPRARKVLRLASDEAEALGHASVGAEHLLLGIVREGEGIANGVLESLLVSPDRIRSQVIEMLGGAQAATIPTHVSPRARKALLQAQLVARWYYHPEVDTQHVLLGLVRELECAAARSLQQVGVDLPRLLKQFEAMTRAPSGLSTPARVDYTSAARAAIDRAALEAGQRGQSESGTGHLLLGVLAVQEGGAHDLLRRLGVSDDAVRRSIEPLLESDE